MHTVENIQAAITLLRLHNPDALRLGELLSLAARIEPELLRAVRLELTPFDAAAEADLWFSPLVETRTADWIALVPAAARELRSALVTDQSSFAAAHELITKAHSSAPATIILEEEILWLPHSGRADATEAIESRLRLVLGKLLEDPRAHRGLAHWFAGAAQRLPLEAQATEAYALLYFVTSGLLDGRRINAPQPALSSIDVLAGTLPASIPKLSLWATLNHYGLTLRPEKMPGFVPLEVPRTEPLLFELRTVHEPHQFITLSRGETKTFPIRSGEVVLRTADGDTYRLRRPHKRATSGVQNLILGFGGTGAHILTALKELTVLKHGRLPENIKFLLFDTIADWEPGKRVPLVGGTEEEETVKSNEDGTSLDSFTEYFQLTDFDPDFRRHVFELLSSGRHPDEFPNLKDWLHAPWFSLNVPQSRLDITAGAAQQRQIARYAIFKNAEKIVFQLRRVINRMADPASKRDISVWLIGSAAGGTGAGFLIDTAYLTKLAAENNRLLLNGVVVLPNVYASVSGINKGRAYSLLRELDRVQERGIPADDRYVDMATQTMVSSRVVYDREGQQIAAVPGRLFDELFYLGSDCFTENERTKFFGSVASAIDPYLDSNSGPLLLESMLSNNDVASSIGAARVYVPTETFKEMFAWEQAAEYMRRAGAPIESNDGVEGLHVGSPQDRADSAFHTFRSLLNLFSSLLDLEMMPALSRHVFARNGLDSRRLVNIWCELSGGSRTPAEQTVLLTYADPCYSLTEAERPNDKREWETKTYKENVAAGGFKETQEESRTRFADRLNEVRRRYTNPNGGERTFEKGRRYVLETLAAHLQKKMDGIFIEGLNLRRWQFAQSEEAPEQGTPLTQLFAEVGWMLNEQGPLRKVLEMIRDLIAATTSDETELRYTHALRELYESRKSGFLDFGIWVEKYQQAARDECSEYIRWFQKHELLKDIQQLVLNVEQRLREWERVLSRLFYALVSRAPQSDEGSALLTVTQIHLKNRVQQRLYRAARSADTLISFGSEPDPQMHGYQEALRNQSTKHLAAELLNRSHWEAGISSEATPTITLVIDSPELTQQRYSLGDIRLLPNELYQFFYIRIGRRLSETDVFDYLHWLQEHRGISPDTVSKQLDARATALIQAVGAPETSTLVYREPPGISKKEVVLTFIRSLGPHSGIERNHSDPNSITLIKVKKPSLDQIEDVSDSRKEYLASRADVLNNDLAHDRRLISAQVFHPFRQELEAWYIERDYLRNVKSGDAPMLPPRVVRLLEDPAMMQLFVHGIATGAIEMTGHDWVWHEPDGDLMLTDYDSQGVADVVKAAINFVLKQGEARRYGKRRISREEVKQSIQRSAQQKALTIDLMLERFVSRDLDDFLAHHAPPELRVALKMVFTFYCDPNTRTSLQFRIDL